MLLGIFCNKRQIFNKPQIEGIELLLFKIVMPAYLFTSTYKNDLSLLLDTEYIIAYLLTFGILVAIFRLFLVKNISTIAICIRILAASYVNAAIYTLPVITILLKNPTAGIIGNIIQVIIIQPTFIIICDILNNKEKSLFKKISSALTTPLIIAPITGMLLNHMQIPLPQGLLGSISQTGSGASDIALFVFGLTLGATKITRQCLRLDLLSIVLAKNLLHPIIAIAIGYFMKLENYWFNSLVIASSAPTGFMVYLISKKFSTEEELIKKVVALSSLISTISLIFIAMMIGNSL